MTPPAADTNPFRSPSLWRRAWRPFWPGSVLLLLAAVLASPTQLATDSLRSDGGRASALAKLVEVSFGRSDLAQTEYTLELLSFLGLASTIWLGLYLIGQPRRTPVVWLTALTLWSLAGIFLDDFMGYNQPSVSFRLQIERLFAFWPGVGDAISRIVVLGWISKLAVVFWFHATTLMRPGGMTRRRRIVVVVGYLIAGVAIVIQIIWPQWLAPPAPVASIVAWLNDGSLVLFFAACLLLFSALGLVNLIEAARAAPNEIVRRQFGLLVGSTLLAGVAGAVVVASGWRGVTTPTGGATGLFLLAVVLLGYGVAQYSAIIEGRTIRRHFTFSLLAVGLMTLVYFAISYLSSVSFGVPMAAYAFVILLAVVTHSLAGNARAVLDYFFVDSETRKLLQVLRRTSNGIGQQDRLEDRLALLLEQACVQVRASVGQVMLILDGSIQVAAAYRWNRTGETGLRPQDLALDDIQSIEPGTLSPPLEKTALVAPLYVDAENVGAVLLGHPVNGRRFRPDEVEVVGYATDRMVELIRAHRLRDEALRRMAQLPDVARPIAGAGDGDPALETVEGALRRMNDFIYLGNCPLSTLRAVTGRVPAGATHVDLGKATHHVLAEAIERLRPEGQRPNLATPREWHHFMILHEAYIMERPNRDVMAELYISEGTFNRRRREAIEAVTRILHESEAGAAGHAG